MKIAVGTKNPVKIASTREAFESLFPGEKIETVFSEVPSGVPPQPFGDETILGARNRAFALKREFPDADYFVGIEGGIVEKGNWGSFADAWCVVIDKKGRESIGGTIGARIPKKIISLVKGEGLELGTAADRFFSQENTKQKQGFVGIMSKGAVDRKASLRSAVLSAVSTLEKFNEIENCS